MEISVLVVVFLKSSISLETINMFVRGQKNVFTLCSYLYSSDASLKSPTVSD